MTYNIKADEHIENAIFELEKAVKELKDMASYKYWEMQNHKITVANARKVLEAIEILKGIYGEA